MNMDIHALYLFLVALVFMCTLGDATDGRSNRARRNLPIGDDDDNSPLTLNITTMPHEPYVYYDKEKGIFTGYIPDLMEEMSRRLEHKRKIINRFYIPADERYGTPKDPNDIHAGWTGMIGDLINNINGSNKAGPHLAAAPMTITSKRAQVVDFLHPFAHVSLKILIQKPHRAGENANVSLEEQKEIFKFNFDVFKPLEGAVWALIFILLIVVWIFTWLMNCFNPYEYGERHNRGLATEDQARLFNITGALWYAFTILQWQGYDRAPRSVAGKILGCVWMVFVTITLLTYTGSLMNMLFWASTVRSIKDPLVPPVNDIRDLINHHDGYTYGCVGNGATYNYLTEIARGEEFKVVKDYFNSEDGKKQLVGSVEEGLEKVRTEKYAFVVESPVAKLEVNRHPCDLMDIGVDLDMRSYGIAVPKNAPYTQMLHQVLLEMIQDGEILELEDKWFTDRQCWDVKSAEKAMSRESAMSLDKPRRVSISMFWSPLVIMAVGIAVSMIAGGAEILWYKYRGRYNMGKASDGHQLTNADDVDI